MGLLFKPSNSSEIITRLKQKLAGVETICDRAGNHALEHALEDLALVLEGIADVPKYRNNGGLKFSEFQVESRDVANHILD